MATSPLVSKFRKPPRRFEKERDKAFSEGYESPKGATCRSVIRSLMTSKAEDLGGRLFSMCRSSTEVSPFRAQASLDPSVRFSVAPGSPTAAGTWEYSRSASSPALLLAKGAQRHLAPDATRSKVQPEIAFRLEPGRVKPKPHLGRRGQPAAVAEAWGSNPATPTAAAADTTLIPAEQMGGSSSSSRSPTQRPRAADNASMGGSSPWNSSPDSSRPLSRQDAAFGLGSSDPAPCKELDAVRDVVIAESYGRLALGEDRWYDAVFNMADGGDGGSRGYLLPAEFAMLTARLGEEIGAAAKNFKFNFQAADTVMDGRVNPQEWQVYARYLQKVFGARRCKLAATRVLGRDKAEKRRTFKTVGFFDGYDPNASLQLLRTCSRYHDHKLHESVCTALEKKADPNAALMDLKFHGYTPLIFLALARPVNGEQVVKAIDSLVAAKADVHRTNEPMSFGKWVPLRFAALMQNTFGVEALLKYVDVGDRFSWAACESNQEVMLSEFGRRYGAEVSEAIARREGTFNNQATALMQLYASTAVAGNLTADGAEKLVNGEYEVPGLEPGSKADPNGAGLEGMTALMDCVLKGELDTVEALLRLKADPRQQDGSGATPLHLAACHAHSDIAQALLRHRAEPHATDHAGMSAAMVVGEALGGNPSAREKARIQEILVMLQPEATGYQVLEWLKGGDWCNKVPSEMVATGSLPAKYPWEAAEGDEAEAAPPDATPPNRRGSAGRRNYQRDLSKSPKGGGTAEKPIEFSLEALQRRLRLGEILFFDSKMVRKGGYEGRYPREFLVKEFGSELAKLLRRKNPLEKHEKKLVQYLLQATMGPLCSDSVAHVKWPWTWKDNRAMYREQYEAAAKDMLKLFAKQCNLMRRKIENEAFGFEEVMSEEEEDKEEDKEEEGVTQALERQKSAGAVSEAASVGQKDEEGAASVPPQGAAPPSLQRRQSKGMERTGTKLSVPRAESKMNLSRNPSKMKQSPRSRAASKIVADEAAAAVAAAAEAVRKRRARRQAHRSSVMADAAAARGLVHLVSLKADNPFRALCLLPHDLVVVPQSWQEASEFWRQVQERQVLRYDPAWALEVQDSASMCMALFRLGTVRNMAEQSALAQVTAASMEELMARGYVSYSQKCNVAFQEKMKAIAARVAKREGLRIIPPEEIVPAKRLKRLLEKTVVAHEERKHLSWANIGETYQRFSYCFHIHDTVRLSFTCCGETIDEQVACCMKLLAEFQHCSAEVDQVCVLRQKSGFAAGVDGSGGYADVKLLCFANLGSYEAFDGTEVPLEIVGEVQLILKGYADVKAKMHLVYEVDRGSFDRT
eukprot:TRINITY_DN11796_c0_g1_i2.p1 TRINITY_DN11796_c0_g1~~TRINITY_DN11796_c0_g1_i2.p1  ORF type:complete len:1314 (-),score=396.41 TRINITY_DN11796_c0_g1_i2:353-4294(-)